MFTPTSPIVDTVDPSTILTVKSLDHSTGIIQIYDPVMTLHLTRVPLSFVDNASIHAYVSSNPAVYVLVGPSDDDAHECRVYVGETGNAAYRLVQHFSPKASPWDVAYVISSNNLAINKTHVRSYESSLYSLISQHPKMLLTNTDVPREFALADYDASLVGRSFPVIVQLLIASGFPLAKLSLFQTYGQSADEENPPTSEDGGGIYVFRPGPMCKFSDLYGMARREGKEFVLLPGSEVRITVNGSFIDNVERKLVVEEGGLKPHPTRSDRMILTRPVRCSGWKSAAGALAGANVMNPNYWVANSNLGEAEMPSEDVSA